MLKRSMILAMFLSLSGCATTDWSQVNLAPMQQYVNSQNQPTSAPPSRQVDMYCKRDCLAAGYTHPLCDSKCGY